MTRARDLAAFVSNADGDIKFDTDTLFIDSSANKVGILTNSPNRALSLEDGDIQIHDTGTSGDPLINFSVGNTQASPTQSWSMRIDNSDSDKFQLLDVTDSRIVFTADGSGNCGFGTSSPNTTLTLSDGTDEFDFGVTTNDLTIKTVTSDGSDDQRIILDAGNGGQSSTRGSFIALSGNEASSNPGQAIYQMGNVSGASHVFRKAGGNDAVTINSIGQFFVNRTSGAIGTDGVAITPAGSASGTFTEIMNDGGGVALSVGRGGSNGTAMQLTRGSGVVGTISVTTSSTSFNTSSDYRLKENVADISDGITRVKQLAPKRFNFIVDADTTVDGFLAHEAATVVPEAVTGTKDAMTEEQYIVTAAKGDVYTPATDDADEVVHSSNVEQPDTLEESQLWRETAEAVMGTRTVPDMQGIDQSKLVPLLTAALQEAIAEIDILKTKVAALEAE